MNTGSSGRLIPAIFTDRWFLLVLAIKLIFAFTFASDFMTRLFIPFLQYFVQNPLSNPYQHFLEIGLLKAFPYPPAMLAIMSVPFFLFGGIAGTGINNAAIFLARLPLLVADLAIFFVLCKLFEGKEKQINLLYWASPVVFYINYIHGQLDVIPIALLVISIYLLLTRRQTWSFAFLALGLASKSHLFVVLPIYLFYLLKSKTPLPRIAALFAGLFAAYLLLLSPYLFSEGFVRLVLEASEQLRVFSLSVLFSQGLLFYIVPAFYLYIMFKAYSFKKITKDAFFMTVGLTFTLLVTLITPAQGWYLWGIPFIAYFFIKEDRLDPLIYHAFGAAYLAYFAFIPASDIFNVFQVSNPSLALMATPYSALKSAGIDADMAVSLLFTALTSTLIYISYLIYKHGIKSSLLFQEKNGTPAIGIAGDSGAGKTTLAGLLSRMFGEGRANIIYGDDVHKWERNHPNWMHYTHLNPIGNYINYNYNQIRNLKSGKAIERQLYDHGTGRFTAPKKIAPRDFIISEGLHTFFIPEASSIYELRIYLDPEAALRLRWKLKRDVEGRNYSAKKVLEQVRRREEDAEKFVRKQKERADIVVSYRMLDKSTILQIDLRTSFSAERLAGALLACKSLVVEHQYLDTSFQRLTIDGSAQGGEMAQALAKAGVDLDDYAIDKSGFAQGLDGVLQAATLFCLNERLKALSGGE